MADTCENNKPGPSLNICQNYWDRIIMKSRQIHAIIWSQNYLLCKRVLQFCIVALVGARAHLKSGGSNNAASSKKTASARLALKR